MTRTLICGLALLALPGCEAFGRLRAEAYGLPYCYGAAPDPACYALAPAPRPVETAACRCTLPQFTMAMMRGEEPMAEPVCVPAGCVPAGAAEREAVLVGEIAQDYRDTCQARPGVCDRDFPTWCRAMGMNPQLCDAAGR